MEYYSLVVEW